MISVNSTPAITNFLRGWSGSTPNKTSPEKGEFIVNDTTKISKVLINAEGESGSKIPSCKVLLPKATVYFHSLKLADKYCIH